MNFDAFIPPTCEYPVKVAGIGDAGLHCLDVIAGENLKDIELVAINTHGHSLSHSATRTRILIGEESTNGIGSGGNPELGRQAAAESADSITRALDGAKTVILLAGFGGGTGTGASPVVARLAKTQGSYVLGVVTIPFTFEGAARQQIARDGVSRLAKTADSLIVLENDRLLRFIERPPTIDQAYSLVAKMAAWHALLRIL